MATQFGPQLIGETEKTLDAILRCALAGTRLSEPEWVALRLASQLHEADRHALVAAITDRAHFADAAQLVNRLAERGLIDGGQLTANGSSVIEDVQTALAEMTAPIWQGLDTNDVVAAERLLNEIVDRARHVLATVER